MHGERAEWAVGERWSSHATFVIHLLQTSSSVALKLEYLGAAAQRHDEAIIQYSTALSLNPVIPKILFMKRSNGHIAKGSWEDAIDDTNQVRHF